MNFEKLKVEDIKLIKDSMLENSVSLIATCQQCKSVMPIDSFYRDMDKANRLIYLVNALNGKQNYNDSMKFYEFNSGDFGYYALIGAKSEEDVIKYYEETVGDIKEDAGSPNEITKNEAKEKLFNICKDKEQKYEVIEEFTKYTNDVKPYLILIDGSIK